MTFTLFFTPQSVCGQRKSTCVYYFYQRMRAWLFLYKFFAFLQITMQSFYSQHKSILCEIGCCVGSPCNIMHFVLYIVNKRQHSPITSSKVRHGRIFRLMIETCMNCITTQVRLLPFFGWSTIFNVELQSLCEFHISSSSPLSIY